MSAHHILVFDPDLRTGGIQAILVEAAWPLPNVRITDMQAEYGDASLDVAQERQRLTCVDTVLLQITESALRSPLLAGWISKVLALEHQPSLSGRPGPPLIKRLRAVIVRSLPATLQERGPEGSDIHRLLDSLCRAVRSVGVEWLEPQVIAPEGGAKVLSAEISLFVRRIQGRDDSVVLPYQMESKKGPIPGHFARGLAAWSAYAALACALGQVLFEIPAEGSDPAWRAAAELFRALLAVCLFAVVACAVTQPTTGSVRILALGSAGLYGVQILSLWLPAGPVSTLLILAQTLAPMALIVTCALAAFEVREGDWRRRASADTTGVGRTRGGSET